MRVTKSESTLEREDFQSESLGPHLSLRNRLELFLFGHSKIGVYKGRVDLYVSKCPIHSLFADYPHGVSSELRCPKCESVFLNGSGAERILA